MCIVLYDEAPCNTSCCLYILLLISVSTSVASIPCPCLVIRSWKSATSTCLYKSALTGSGRSCDCVFIAVRGSHFHSLKTYQWTEDRFIWWAATPFSFISFNHSGYFYSASSSPLLLRGAPNYSIDTVSELLGWIATGNCEWRTCPRSLHSG